MGREKGSSKEGKVRELGREKGSSKEGKVREYKEGKFIINGVIHCLNCILYVGHLFLTRFHKTRTGDFASRFQCMMSTSTIPSHVAGCRSRQHVGSFQRPMPHLAYHNKQSGAVEACWAHNPEVDGSKPFSAMNFFFHFTQLTFFFFFPSLYAAYIFFFFFFLFFPPHF